MKNKELENLIDKYLAGTATKEEIELLNNHYDSINEDAAAWEDETEIEVKQRIFSNIGKSISYNESKTINHIWYKIAAAILLFIGLFSFFKINYLDVNQLTVSADKVVDRKDINRYILLPDSSIVILKPGAELNYPVSFVGDTRVVKLKGEAYFDIKHKDNQPFIIESAGVKTTVLGTAFTIKSNEKDDIEVFVHRGKVKVEKEQVELAVLTANHKLTYQSVINSSNLEKQALVELAEFEWSDSNLKFDDISFQQIVRVLEQRYDVKIIFSDDSLKTFKLSGTFSGLETIDEMLSILCQTSNSVYTSHDPKTYEIKHN